MGELAEVIYKDLLARGKKSDTALRWRTWVERFETVAGIINGGQQRKEVDTSAPHELDGHVRVEDNK